MSGRSATLEPAAWSCWCSAPDPLAAAPQAAPPRGHSTPPRCRCTRSAPRARATRARVRRARSRSRRRASTAISPGDDLHDEHVEPAAGVAPSCTRAAAIVPTSCADAGGNKLCAEPCANPDRSDRGNRPFARREPALPRQPASERPDHDPRVVARSRLGGSSTRTDLGGAPSASVKGQ
jgi:hypothetical protein